MELLTSPFQPAFREFINTVESECYICSPYITARPVQELVATATQKTLQNTLSIHLITDLSAVNLAQGATDIEAILFLMSSLPGVQLTYLPRIHAKVFIADEKLALLGSANFTDGGAERNLEYGVRIREKETIHRIRDDMNRYAALGASVSSASLHGIAGNVRALREELRSEQATIRKRLRLLSEELEQKTQDDLIRIRVKGRSVNAIFSETILYLLRRGDMTTAELNQAVQTIHSDLCDDSFDRVIDGKHYGKLWKHQVRGAQVALRRRGLVDYDSARRVWFLPGGGR